MKSDMPKKYLVAAVMKGLNSKHERASETSVLGSYVKERALDEIAKGRLNSFEQAGRVALEESLYFEVTHVSRFLTKKQQFDEPELYNYEADCLGIVPQIKPKIEPTAELISSAIAKYKKEISRPFLENILSKIYSKKPEEPTADDQNALKEGILNELKNSNLSLFKHIYR